MMAAVMLVACSKQQGEDKATSAIDEYEAINGNLAAMMNRNPDSMFIVLDSLEATARYPECIVNVLRGNVYARMVRLRFAEFYLRKAIGEELHDTWPRGYYNGLYNLGAALMQKGNLEEALKVSQASYKEVLQETDPSLKVWQTSLLFVIGSSQLALHQLDEADKTMQKCHDLLADVIASDTTHVTMEMFATMSSNIATSYYNGYPEASMPWIERAEKSLDIVAEHNKHSQEPSVEPILRAKMEMLKAICYATIGKTKEAKTVFDAFMASPFANHPVILIEQLTYLERTNQWDAAADLLPAISEIHEGMQLDYTMDNLSNVAESYRVFEKAGRKADATRMAQQMAAMVDSVSLYQQKDDAAELAVIYATHEKDQQIAEQQLQMSRVRVLTLVITIIALIVFFVIFHITRQRAAKRLAMVNAAKERMEGELRIARDIQMSMVPSQFPEYDGLDMYASMSAAKEVGGDLYGYVLQGDNLYFALGDVSGKGVPASLFMAQATRLFRTLATQGMMPAEICTRMNEALSGDDNQNGMFVTFFLGLVNLKTGHMDFCNAGHNPPVLGGGDNNGDFLQMIPNAPIGLWPGLQYEGEELDSIKGRPLFLYTDGLNEAENQQLEQFGDERLLDLLRYMHFDSAKQVIDALTREVERHRNGAEPNDDLTMLCLRIS